MSIETIVQLIGLACLGAVLLRVAASSLVLATAEVVHRRDRTRQLRDFAERLANVEPTKKTNQNSAWQGKRRFRVVRRVYESLDNSVCSFYLAPLDRRPLPLFQPGQFLSFELPSANGSGTERRCYSLSDMPSSRGPQTDYRVTIKRLGPSRDAPPGTPPGYASNYFHQLGESSVVDVFAPTGQFVLDRNSQRPVVLIAGGVGITPMIAMMNWLVANQPARQAVLFIGFRNRSDHIMYEYLQQLRSSQRNVRIVVFYSQPTTRCRLGVDYDVEGRIDVSFLSKILTGGGYQFYICGPDAMMNSVLTGLSQWGVPDQDVSFEAFGSARVSSNAGPRALTSDVPNDAAQFNVNFSRSQKRVRWSHASANILELAEANGVNARFGCRAGGCGACETKILSGKVSYSQQPIVQPKPGSCLTCIAQPDGDLSLDL